VSVSLGMAYRMTKGPTMLKVLLGICLYFAVALPVAIVIGKTFKRGSEREERTHWEANHP